MNKDKNKNQGNLNYKHLMKIIDMIEMLDIEMTFAQCHCQRIIKLIKKTFQK